jgi:hypothetical protein
MYILEENNRLKMLKQDERHRIEGQSTSPITTNNNNTKIRTGTQKEREMKK